MKPYLVDVPVRVMIWNRPDLQRKQFEVLRQARPSIMFLVSDGGRTEAEQALIVESRRVFDDIDWECTIYRYFFDSNNGMYTMMKLMRKEIWSKVDRCVFLEDDYIPSVRFFSYCAELLEKYKDDERIQQITGHNVFETYLDAEPYDYFFTQEGWSIWGTATWKRVAMEYEYPLDYADNEYMKKCLKQNCSRFWYKKVIGYCNGELVDGHVPGSEYFTAINSALNHRLSIVPTRNMISNEGMVGTHSDLKKIKKLPKYFCTPTYELDHEIRHPKYVIDDKDYGKRYRVLLGHDMSLGKGIRKIRRVFYLMFTGQLFSKIRNRIDRKRNPVYEK